MTALPQPTNRVFSITAWVGEDMESWIRFGNYVLALLMIGLMIATGFSISGAVLSNGVVNVESNYKTVQHLEGGIVSRILVRNGDRVNEGDVLVRLDDTAARASLTATAGKVNDLLVQQARLEAERDGHTAMLLPPEIEAGRSSPAITKIIEAQSALFRARHSAHRGEQAMLRQRLEQTTNEAAGIAKMYDARRKEAELNARELAALKPLYDRGYTNTQRVMPVQRDNARLEGEVGRLMTDLSRSRAAIAEAELKLAQSTKEYTQAVVDELRKVQVALAEAIEQRTALDDRLRRTEIRAPRAGRVHAISTHTEGGVIQPGTPIMQVIPEGERLLIDAQLLPQDIDKVREGQPAYVRFPAFNAKATPRLAAQVVSISPAQVTDKDNKSFFTAQIALADGELAKLPKGHGLVPGMPAEVYIETSSRSIISYLLKPLLDALARTFNET